MSAIRSSVRRRLSDWFDSVLHWDRRMVHAIGENRKLNKFDRMFVTATFLGDGYIWAALGLGLLLFGGAVDRRYVGIGFFVTVANIVVFRLIKTLTGRVRPENKDEKEERLRTRIDGYSFPSGHATTSFGLAWVIFNCYPHVAVQTSVYVVAATIAFSRVVVREHYPLDVLGGALLGSAVAVSLVPIFTRLLF
ncbi:phosphatase PAP2 family protein [Candidatus Bipolaricaulota bacterium]|nr:phosphatase PAP2 family protein [Candidatus Bipolaricaulota bacterium]